VMIGRRRPGEVEVLQGLTAEDAVVVDGTLNLRDNVAVNVQPDALASDSKVNGET
jgi:membrane fusion protein, multidrug efflux system